MFWDNNLNKVVAVLNDRPALKNIYQNPSTGEWVASDGRLMLIERNGAIPMFEFWSAQDGNPTSCASSYPDYQHTRAEMLEKATKLYVLEPVKRGEFVIFDNKLKILASQWNIIRDFLGDNIRILLPGYGYTALCMESADKQREAFVMPIKSDRWEIVDLDGTVTNTIDNYKEAVNFLNMLGSGYIIRSE